MQVLCLIQDGTSKASLELKGEKVRKAFGVSEHDERRFKDYCLKFGAFIHPSSNQYSPLYKDILGIFKKNESWTQLIFYCKPYFKNTIDKKQNQQSNFGGAGQNQGGVSGYNETISKPTFLLKEKEKEVFLNGEVTMLKDVPGLGGNGTRSVKKTMVSLKCLEVDDNLRQQALRNVLNR